MNTRTSFTLLAVFATVCTLPMSSAFAGAYPALDGNDRDAVKQMMLEDVPIYVWTDQDSYEHNSVITVKGNVANWSAGIPVTLTVVNPLNTIVTIDQIQVNEDGSFKTTISTAGQLWKYDGVYAIKVNYGSIEKSNKVLVELAGGTDVMPRPPMPVQDDDCIPVQVSNDVFCIPFDVSGAMVTGASINTDDNILVIQIDSDSDGMLTLSPPGSVIKGIFMVLVDNEQWDDVEINGNNVTVMFPAGTETIEIIGTWIVPEFGTIAVMILVVAIVSIIAISARSRLSIMPRY